MKKRMESSDTAVQWRERYLTIVIDALHIATAPGTIKSSFKGAGLVPFNPCRVLDAKALEETQVLATEIAEKKKKRSRIKITGGNGYYGAAVGLAAVGLAAAEAATPPQKVRKAAKQSKTKSKQ